MKTKGRYKVFDAYECYNCNMWDGKPDLLGSGDTLNQVKAIVDERREDTDGEMYIIIYDTFKQCEVGYDDINA